MSTPRYAREVAPRAVVGLQRGAAAQRPIAIIRDRRQAVLTLARIRRTERPGLSMDDALREAEREVAASEAEKRRRMTVSRVFIRGRMRGAREVWDVLKVRGPHVELYAAGCGWYEEAVEMAVACLSGRVCVASGGTRRLVKVRGKGVGGGILTGGEGKAPGRVVTSRFDARVDLRPGEHGVEVIPRKGAPAIIEG